MRRILLTVMLCTVLIVPQAFAASSISSNTETEISLLLNGAPLQLDSKPILQGGVTYVPMRSLLTALGAIVQWDELTGTVTATHNDHTVKLKVNDNIGWTNGKEVSIAHPPKLINGKVFVSLRWMNESFGAVVKWQAQTHTVSVYYPNVQLPRVGSYEHLLSLVGEMTGSSSNTNQMFREENKVLDHVQATSADSAVTSESANAAGASDYSTTNVQVQGVDEADIVKSDGTYIYQVINQGIVITRAYPADQMTVVSRLDWPNNEFIPAELYVDNNQLIVIGSTTPGFMTDAKPLLSESKMILPGRPIVTTTKAFIYNITDKSKPELIRELELEGSYVSSRKIGSSLYMISNKYMNYFMLKEQPELALPMYSDSKANPNKKLVVDYDDIRYFPNSMEPNYMFIAGINLNDPEAPMNVDVYLGSGHNIYASTEHLYVAVSQSKPLVQTQATFTTLYKFALSNATVTYMAGGEVPGTILNQFSMDEHDGNFRIATTTGEQWRTDEFTSKNNLFVLNTSLDIVGSVENIAPGEKIYSVRFMGDRAYMVTFRTVDPLFVISLEDPANPHILGALKIPGYSDYLHPYDENHIIGFGKDTIEQSIKDNNGNIVQTTAYNLGMKVAMFDVTDVANPKQLHTLNIGDRGTNSELLYNHKALLFSRDKNLMAFPVELYEVKSTNAEQLDYGQFVYQGAYIYNIDITNGFTLRGRITHISDEELSKVGQYWYDSEKNVRRILYMDQTLYTLSNRMIKAHTINNLQTIGSLNIQK